MVPKTETIPVSDHYQRSIHFLNLSRTAETLEVFNWSLMASVYSGRAVIEIVYDRLKKGYLGKDHEQFVLDARTSIKHFKLIETMRVQDFHRHPVKFSPTVFSVLGPARGKTSTQKGSLVGWFLDPDTGVFRGHTLRNAKITMDRPLQANGMTALDPDIEEFVVVDVAVEQYLIGLREYLVAFHESFDAWLPKIILQDLSESES